MNAVLLDTHAWVWSLTGDPRLSARAVETLMQAVSVIVSPISLFELGQKVRIGKWPEMEPLVQSLPRILEEQGGQTAPLSPEICLRAALLDWAHRDPFDRFLAATALEQKLPLISADEVFDSLPGLKRLW